MIGISHELAGFGLAVGLLSVCFGFASGLLWVEFGSLWVCCGCALDSLELGLGWRWARFGFGIVLGLLWVGFGLDWVWTKFVLSLLRVGFISALGLVVFGLGLFWVCFGLVWVCFGLSLSSVVFVDSINESIDQPVDPSSNPTVQVSGPLPQANEPT